jgi:hypothetical protein
MDVDRLATIDVRAIGDLRRAVETLTEHQRGARELAQYVSLLRKFDTRQQSIETMLNGARQYAWEA